MPASLFRRALAWSNLFEAWRKVRDNRGCAGVDGVTIEDFERDLNLLLVGLQKAVLSGDYRPQPLLACEIEKDDGKPRRLAIPTVADRVLQTAVALVLTPILEAEFEDCSFAYRRGRSVRLAVERVERYRDEGFRWVVDADISGFFDHIDIARMLAELRRLVTDAKLIDLVGRWIRCEVCESGRIRRTTEGIPQGSPLSPLLANLYLDRLDEAILDENLRLVRFADDFVILCRSRDRAEEALELTGQVLEQLRLKLNDTKTRIVDFNQGFRFLGVNFVRTLAVPSGPRARSSRRPPILRPIVPLHSVTESQDPLANLPAEAAPNAPQSSLAEAFQRAGLDPGDFAAAPPAQETPVAPVPEITTQDFEEDIPEPIGSEPTPTGMGPSAVQADPLLRTLYVLEQGCEIRRCGERLIVEREGKELESVPVDKLDLVMVFGNSSVTTPATQLCLLEGVPIAYLSALGRLYGMAEAFEAESVATEAAQFMRAADPDFPLELAKAFVRGKIANARVIVKRLARHRPNTTLRDRQLALRESAWRVKSAKTLNELRGIEGAAGHNYFVALQQALPSEWRFTGRNRQPPRDPINVLLSFGYTLLARNVHALLRARRLNPMVGFLHPARPGHPALVSDLMEEFRPIVVDALVLDLALHRRLTPDDFASSEEPEGGCRARPAALRTFIHAFERKMRTTIRHPASREPLDYRRCIDRQAVALARLMRDPSAEYVPLVMR